MTTFSDAAAAATMSDVRAGIDALDTELIRLLAQRVRFIERAAALKSDRAAVRDEWRKQDVLAKVQATALCEGLPADLAAALWELLIEASIAYEFEVFDAR